MTPKAAVDTFSYAAPDDPWLKRAIIRAVEIMTGQPTLKRMYLENYESPVPGETFWDAAVRHLKLRVHVNQAELEALPRIGPLMVIANHPFGVLDGIVISQLIGKVRPDFKILTNAVLYRAEEIRPFLLPIDFSPSKEALETNIKSRAEARDHLVAGKCVVVFPAGGIATSKSPFRGPAIDAEWGTFAAGMIHQAKAPVAPVYFAGQNSRLFQMASHMSMTLRLSLVFKEVYDRIGTDLPVRVGAVIPYEELAPHKDRKGLMKLLRDRTMVLGRGLVPPASRARKVSRRERRLAKVTT